MYMYFWKVAQMTRKHVCLYVLPALLHDYIVLIKLMLYTNLTYCMSFFQCHNYVDCFTQSTRCEHLFLLSNMHSTYEPVSNAL